MFEALEYYQSLAQKFQGQILTGPGIAVVLAGICIWLAGLRWKMVLGGLSGGAMAVAAVMSVGDFSAVIICVAAAVGIFIGAGINRIALGIFGAILTAVIVLVVMAGGLEKQNIEDGIEFFDANQYDSSAVSVDDFCTSSAYPTWPQYQAEGVVITAAQAVEVTTEMLNYFIDNARAAVKKTGTASYTAAGIAAVFAVVLAMAVNRLFIASISAAIGTAVIFIGMIMLLFFKGSEPISLIAARGQFYAVVCGAMILFGMAVQLLLSPAGGKNTKIIVAKRDKNGDG